MPYSILNAATRHQPGTTRTRTLAFLVTLIFSAPFSVAEEEKILNIYNWEDYIGQTTIADFEKEYGIEVNYDGYDSSEIVDAKMMAGGSGYDLVCHSAAFSARLIEAGLYRPLDWDKLGNRNNLDKELLAQFARYDPDNLHGVPYMWGTTGFAYNRGMLLERMPDAPLNSAEMVFNPEIAAKFADCGISLLDSPTDTLSQVMIYLGYPSSSIEPKHLEEAEAVLKSIRPYVKYFSSTKLLLDLPAKEVCIAGSWSGDYSIAARNAREAGIDIDLGYNNPKEGGLIWFDAFFIPKDARHVENAHLFLDYLMRPEVIAAISNFTAYANANIAATPLIDDRLRNDPAVYPDKSILKNLQAGKIYEPKLERRRQRTWTRIKSGL